MNAVTDLKDAIARLLVDAEQAAYAHGWTDAITAVINAVNQLAQFHEVEKLPKLPERMNRGRPASKATAIVEKVIAVNPGMLGVEVIKAVHKVDESFPERTLRTALRRLRLRKAIWKRNDRWYPRNKGRPENANGEALGPPPR